MDRETTKLHIVFDASAKVDKAALSLNDSLEKGPNGIPHLFDILLKFRSHPIGLTADIEKAFHQIIIEPKDRDALRFLWFSDINKDKPEIVRHQFCRLVFGLTPSPAILTETIQHHLTRYLLSEPHIVKQLAESFYVDDYTSGVYNEEEEFKLHQRAKEIMLAGGFNLQKWRTNSVLLQHRITEAEEKSLNVAPSQKVEPCRIKILGLSWDIEANDIYFDLKEAIAVATSLPSTRRSVLKIPVKFFDPLGVISPFVIGIKIMFQLLCKDKVDWDQELEGHVLKRWKQLTKEFEALSRIKIPRCYYLVGQTPVLQQIHGFCDALERAYAATKCLRLVYDNGDVRVCLTSVKTCVAPLKRQTIPVLEFLGAMILACLVDRILSCLIGNPEIYCWTDSFAVLCWIKNKKTWKQYVQHRVAEIRRLTNQDVWIVCPSPENPADVAS